MFFKSQAAALALAVLSALTMAIPIKPDTSVEASAFNFYPNIPNQCKQYYGGIGGTSVDLSLDEGRPGLWYADSLLDNMIHYRASIAPRDDKMELKEYSTEHSRLYNVFVIHTKKGDNFAYRVEPGQTCNVPLMQGTSDDRIKGVSVRTVNR